MKDELHAMPLSTEVTVSVFGPLTDLFSEQRFPGRLALPAGAEEIRAQLVEQHPQLAAHRFMIAADNLLVGPDARVESASEIALLPAFAGG